MDNTTINSSISYDTAYPHVLASSAPKHALLAVLSVILVLGNGVLIWTILHHKRLRTVTNLFVVALAFADFSMGFPTIPIHIIAERQVMSKTGSVCLFSMALTSAQCVVSVIMLFALSVERYLNLVHPFKHRTHLTRKRAVIVIVLCWTYALMFGMIPVLGWNSVPNMTNRNQTLPLCRFEFVLTGGYIALLFLGHVVPASLILPLLHIRVFLTARRVLRRHADMNDHIPRKTSSVSSNPEQSIESRTKRNLRPFKILVVMVLYFIISWIPLTVWEVIVFKGFRITNPDPQELFDSTMETNSYFITVGLAVMNSVINPLFYGVGSRNIRKTFVMGVKKTCGYVESSERVRYSYASCSQNGTGVTIKVVPNDGKKPKKRNSNLHDLPL